MLTPLDPEAFAAEQSVSRETMARLEAYANNLRKWQAAINLVGPDTLQDIWRRHFLDSAQLITQAPAGARVWVDIGAGAGFPGLVLAILGAPEVHLIESDGRKCVFLQETARLVGAKVHIHRCRAEQVADLVADVIVARAVAPLVRLLELASSFLTPDTTCLFLKGQDVGRELTEAAKCWNMQTERLPSRSDPTGSIIRLRGCCRG